MPELSLVLPPEKRRANAVETAKWFGVATVTIGNWVRRGCPQVRPGMKGVEAVFDLREVARWYYGRQTQPEKEGAADPETMSPKERLDHYKALREKLALEKDQGDVIDAEEAAKAWADQIHVAKGRLMTVPTRVSQEVVGKTDAREVERIMKRAIVEILEELADGSE